MPSCVVKNCKNHSGSINKTNGITFHRFPSANDPWKNDWIQIIRESRKETDWNPSKSSVVCSTHFEESDLYTTKGGLLRVVTYAVPKKFLYKTSDEGCTSSASQEITSEPPKVIEITEANTPSITLWFPVEDSNIEIEEIVETNTSSVLYEESLKDSSKAVTLPSGDDMNQPLSVLYARKERYMNERLKKMHALIVRQRKKIKILNQKVRRFRSKNKSLKDIVKKLKEQRKKKEDIQIYFVD